MTDATVTPLSVEERADILAKALRKYRGDGYAVQLSADGLTATLSRRKRVRAWPYVIGALFTVGITLIVLVVKLRNAGTETVVLRVDARGKLIRA